MLVRVIEYHIRGFEPVRLEAEIGLEELKVHQSTPEGGAWKTILRSKTPRGVMQEAYAMFAAYNLVRRTIQIAARTHGLKPAEVRFVDNAAPDARSARPLTPGPVPAVAPGHRGVPPGPSPTTAAIPSRGETQNEQLQAPASASWSAHPQLRRDDPDQKLTRETKFVLYIFCEEKDEMPVAAIEWTAKIVYKVAKACKDTEASIQVATPNLITGADQLKASKQNVLDKAKEILNPTKDLKRQ